MIGPRDFLLGGVAALALGGTAIAADVPIKGPIYKAAPQLSIWEGPYIGVHAGYASATNDVAFGAAGAQFEPDGGFGGIQLGYLYRIRPNWLLGYEIDVSFASLRGERVIGGPTTFSLDLFGTARTRLGYAAGPWLVYATGGLAWAKTDVTGPGVQSLERPHIGWTAGAGIEYAFAPRWSAKLEYLYANLGDTLVNLGGGAVFTTDLTLSTVRLGLNYRFGAPAGALAYDAPVAAAFPGRHARGPMDWTGSYIGLHAGYGWGSLRDTQAAISADLEPSGGFGGFQAGYNWQMARNWLVGIESDSSWGAIEQSIAGAIRPTFIDIDSSGTVRARLGYTMDRLLIYGTGGLAWAHVDSRTVGNVDYDRYFLGWAAGAGIEYAFAPRWTAKLEYIYADYGSLTDNFGILITDDLSVHSVKLGINYRASLLELIGWR